MDLWRGFSPVDFAFKGVAVVRALGVSEFCEVRYM